MQGPESSKVVEGVLKRGSSLEKLKFMDHVEMEDRWGGRVKVSRSGYTGEDGFELSV